MLRPSYALDPPPTALSVGGSSYPIDSDYRTWIEVLRLMRNIDPQADTMEWRVANLKIEREIELKVFGGVLADENSGDILRAVSEFASGYPEAPINGLPMQKRQTYSFDWDLNYIVLAIRAQYGIDISYRCEHLHWWEFLIMFRGLCGDHYILRLMEVRGYDGKDYEMQRSAARFALPVEMTEREKAEQAAFEALFEPHPQTEEEETDEV